MLFIRREGEGLPRYMYVPMRRSFFALILSSLMYGTAGLSSREDYCSKHQFLYRQFCANQEQEADRELFFRISKFCPGYEELCVDGKENSFLLIPPPLPKVAAFDLPIKEELELKKFVYVPAVTPRVFTPGAKLTPEIVATCTPDCREAHCTDLCKCAYTHPRVHRNCNPPANADIAHTCHRWYQRCPMFRPVSY